MIMYETRQQGAAMCPGYTEPAFPQLPMITSTLPPLLPPLAVTPAPHIPPLPPPLSHTTPLPPSLLSSHTITHFLCHLLHLSNILATYPAPRYISSVTPDFFQLLNSSPVSTPLSHSIYHNPPS